MSLPSLPPSLPSFHVLGHLTPLSRVQPVLRNTGRQSAVKRSEKAAAGNVDLPPIVTMFTAPYHSSNPQKTRIQHNVINALAALPRVRVALFTTDDEYKELGAAVGATVYTEFETAIGTVPVLRDMFARALDGCTTPMVGFVNGDILLSKDFADTVAAVQAAMDDGRLTNRTFLVGRRYNIVESLANGTTLPTPATLADVEALHTMLVGGKNVQPFLPRSADYFVYSRAAVDWRRDVPPFVIGRIAYDNWLMQYGLQAGIDVVDGTATIIDVHMTDSGGVVSGSKAQNRNYNKDMANGLTNFGSASYSRFATARHPVDEASLKKDEHVMPPPSPPADGDIVIVQRRGRGWLRMTPEAVRQANSKPCDANPDWWTCVDERTRQNKQ